MDKWFVFDPDGNGFVTYETEAEARAVAQECIDEWRNVAIADREWSDYVDGLCWGKISEAATRVEIISEYNETCCDYMLAAIDAEAREGGA